MGTTRPGKYGLYEPVLADLVKLASQDIPAMQASVEGRLAEVAAGVAAGVLAAQNTADDAVAKANSAVATANSANTTADDASTAASNAVTTANDAKATADGIAATAQAADGKATTALSTAADALTTAQSSTSATMSRGNVARDTDGVPYLIPAVIAPPLTGTGSPYNVLTPSAPGQEYTDTAGTCGAWRWMSTGTTKTSWVVTTGDTGPRNIASLIGSDWTLGQATLQRTGNIVSLVTQMNSATLSGTVQVLLLADGFRPGGSAYLQTPRYTTGSSMHGLLNVSAPSGLVRGFGTVVSGSVSYASLTWATPDPWPTTLPGTPA